MKDFHIKMHNCSNPQRAYFLIEKLNQIELDFGHEHDFDILVDMATSDGIINPDGKEAISLEDFSWLSKEFYNVSLEYRDNECNYEDYNYGCDNCMSSPCICNRS